MQMKWERNANPKQFTSQTGLCLHGTVLYVCMYLISLYEDYVFFFFLFSIILLHCSDLCLLFGCILCNTMCCKRTKCVILVSKQKPEDICVI